MKFSVERSYLISAEPENEEDELDYSESCRLTVTMTGADTVMFTANTPYYDVINGLMGICPEGIWFLDPYANYGFLLEAPFCFEDIYDEIQGYDEYDDVQWLFLAKCIEVMAADLFPTALNIDHPIPKPSCATTKDEDDLPF